MPAAYAFVATLTGQPSHRMVADALTALRNLERRGALPAASRMAAIGAGVLIGRSR
jgi:glutamate synthase (NADPH/NADH) large chain